TSTFIASTPPDKTAPAADAGADADEPAETNNHLLVAHQLVDQAQFLRAQTLITLATLAKHRWTRSDAERLNPRALVPHIPARPVVHALLTETQSAIRSFPTHIAVLAAADRVFELAKACQVDGVVEAEENDVQPAAAVSKSGKKKSAAASVLSAADTS